jgi:hypothetical protein
MIPDITLEKQIKFSSKNWHRMGRPAQENGLRLWNDLLEKNTRLAKSRRMGQNPTRFACGNFEGNVSYKVD